MTINSYLAGDAMNFSKLPLIVWISVTAEWICFLCFSAFDFCGSGRRSPVQSRREKLFCLLLLLASVLLEQQFYAIALHCTLQILLWTVFLCICCSERWHNGVFESCFFCLLLELGKSMHRGGTLAWLLWKWFPEYTPKRISHITFAAYLCYILVLAILFLWLSSRRKKRSVIPGRLSFNAPLVAGLLFPVFLYLMIRQLQPVIDSSVSVNMYLYLDLIDVAVAGCAVIVMIVTISMLRSEVYRNELLRNQLLQEQQHGQYLIQKEAMDAVNRKYHDLKHYLNAIENADSPEELIQFAKEMGKQIEPVETIQETGNQTVNILLSQRIRECREKEIRFIPYLDGRNLSFMNTVDLCTLFGNAMDNAIEASCKIADPSQREINARIEHYGNLIIFRFQNRYDQPVRREGNIIPSSKPDAASHGYGIASIREIAEKYGGTISIETQGNVFELSVIIPAP